METNTKYYFRLALSITIGIMFYGMYMPSPLLIVFFLLVSIFFNYRGYTAFTRIRGLVIPNETYREAIIDSVNSSFRKTSTDLATTVIVSLLGTLLSELSLVSLTFTVLSAAYQCYNSHKAKELYNDITAELEKGINRE